MRLQRRRERYISQLCCFTAYTSDLVLDGSGPAQPQKKTRQLSLESNWPRTNSRNW